MNYAKARTYAHNRGRFLQPDPLGLGAADLTAPQSLNLYGYVRNDPVNFVDPTGLEIIAVTSCVTIKLDGEIIGIDCETVYYITSGGPVALPVPIGGGIGGGGGEGGGDGQNPTPGTINDLRNSICNDKALLESINACLRQLLGKNFNKVGEQTLANAPKIDARLTSRQIAAKFKMSASPYAVGAGHVGGRNGTIFIGSEWFNNPVDWTVNGRGTSPGRTPLQNAYVHELGNLASYRASGGKTYGLFGVKGAPDEDSGYQLQKCVFGN